MGPDGVCRPVPAHDLCVNRKNVGQVTPPPAFKTSVHLASVIEAAGVSLRSDPR